ncbi:MAG: SWF/SNF helicase family protein, partial [Chloroflexi bacterium]|nr:SWF/SNF helicase family protein [Chloroflexota bacterium]
NDLADAIAFVKQGRRAENQGRLRIAVLSKQRLKDGTSWVPAVLKRTAYRHISLETLLKELPAAEAEEVQRRITAYQLQVNDTREIPPDVRRLMRREVTVYQCPDCGKTQVYPTGANKGCTIVNDDGYFCQSLRRCCSDVIQEEKKTVTEGCGSFLAQQGRNLGRVQDIPPATTGLGRVAPPTVRYQRVPVPTEPTEVDPYENLGWADLDDDGDPILQLDPVYLDAPAPTRTQLVVQAPRRCLEPDPTRPGEYQIQWYDTDGQPVTVAKSTPPPLPRLSVSEWLRAQGRDQVGAVVFDEVHGYSAEDTNAGYALGEMLSLADQAMLMTGTLHSGYARSIFYLAHRVSSQFRRRYGYRDVGAFVRTYGYEEKRYVTSEGDSGEYGNTRWSTRTRTYTKEIPGVSPALVAEFLGYTIFTSLADLGVSLPPIDYRLVPVVLDPEHHQYYERYQDDCRKALRAGVKSGVRLAGSFLHTLSSYAIAPWRAEQLLDKYGGEWASAPNLELVCPVCGLVKCKDSQCEGYTQCPVDDEPRVQRARLFAHEQALLDELQAQVDRGRRTVVFLDYTGTRDIVTPRLLPLCQQRGFRTLFCTVSAQKRGAWIEKHAPGCDVMLVNTTAASVGLNLIQFQTAVFYQTPYSGTVFQQAPARLRRPTQTQGVEIVYLNALDTLVEKALALMFKKRGAAGDFRGESLAGSLGDLTASGSFLDELVSQVLDGRDVAVDLEALFARFARTELDRDTFLQTYDLTIDSDDTPVVQTLTVQAQRRTEPLPPLVAVQLTLF